MIPALLFETAFKSTGLLLTGWIATQLMTRSSAAARHLVWTAAFLGNIVLTFVILFGPTWRLAAIPARWSHPQPIQPLSQAVPSAAVGPGIQTGLIPSGGFSQPPAVGQQSPVRTGVAFPAIPIPIFVFALWAAGAVLTILRIIIGLFRAMRVAKEATVVTTNTWNTIVTDVSTTLNLKHQVSLLRSRQVTVPCICGIFQPCVLLPFEADCWDDQRVRFVLMHELAHVKRWDCLVQTIVQFSVALHWFNPMARIGAARISVEQERACDDMVLAAGTSAPEYANELLKLVRSFRPQMLSDWAALPMSRPSHFAERLSAILDEARSRRSPSLGLRRLVLFLTCICAVPLGALRLVASVVPLSVRAPVPETSVVVNEDKQRGDQGVNPVSTERDRPNPSLVVQPSASQINSSLSTRPQNPSVAISRPLEPDFKIVFANRLYEQVGPSHIDWMGIHQPGQQAVKMTDTEKNRCVENPGTPASAEFQARAESSIAGNGKLLTWSADGTLFAYVARDPSVPPPSPNPWGGMIDFYPDLRIVRASDTHVLATVRLPAFSPEPSEHWNYAQTIKWSLDSKTILVGSEAGSSEAHFEDYWLLDWAKQSWRYVGGGNDARWSPDSYQILWSTPRRLEELGKVHVWVTHLLLLDIQSLKQEVLTSGTSFVSDFRWCSK